MKPEITNSFCWYPFYQLTVRGFKQDTVGATSPCCNMLAWAPPFQELHNIKVNSFNDLFHHPTLYEIRKKMLAGERPKECKICWDAEKRNHESSLRFKSANDIPVGYSVDIYDPKLVTLDISTGNNCNLRCRMCQPGSSNKLKQDMALMTESEINEIGWNVFKLTNGNFTSPGFYNEIEGSPEDCNAWKILETEDIKKIKVIGGEALITDTFIELLDKLIVDGKSKNIELFITTNGTKFTDEILNKLAQFKRLEIILSVDATDASYEYIRYPMRWNKLDQSIRRFKDVISTDYYLGISSVLSIYNIFDIKNLFYWAESIGVPELFLDNLSPINRGTDIVHLPSYLINDAYNELTGLNVTGPGYDYLKSLSQGNSQGNSKKILSEIQIFDRVRNQDYHNFLDGRIVNFLDL